MSLKNITVYDPPEVRTALRSLDDFNAEKQARWEHLTQLQPNGIACPSCGHECGESATGPQLQTQPPRWAIRCLSCEWSGYRVAC